MHSSTVAVWKLIQLAGAKGLLMDEIKAAMPQLDDVSKRVTNLRGMGYIKPTNADKRPRYVVTTKVPVAAIASGAAEVDDAADEAEIKAEARSKAPQGVPPGVPSSVFHLGQMRAEAAAAPASAAPAPAPAGRGGHLASGTRVVERDEREHFVPAFEGTPIGFMAAGPWRDPRVSTPMGEVLRPRTPHFELHSDGVLVIDPAGDGTDPITLPPTLTRHLFRWLDCIGGLQLSRLVAAQADAEAAS